MKVPTERLREMLAACEGVTPGPWAAGDSGFIYTVDGHAVADVGMSSDKILDHIAACDPDTIRSALSELLELREAVKPADDPESILYSLQIASIGAPYSDVQGNLYCHPPYSPDGFRDAEFRDYGLARAVRIICNNAKALARSLQSHTGEA